MYVVTKTGVYLQDVFGPFESEDTAKAQAQLLAMDDTDDYHEWNVCPLGAIGLGDVVARYRKWGRYKRGEQCGNDEREAYTSAGRKALD